MTGMGQERFLITGAQGCIGAWVVTQLVREEASVIGLDVAPGPGRARLLLDAEQLERVNFVQGDVSDKEAVKRIIDEHAITHLIHLAALQYPYCRDDHLAGARVNVLGTLSIFDAVLARKDQVKLAYASSVGALSEGTLYGTWKVANEGMAAAFWTEDGLASVGIRPALVYGVGRDRGVSAAMSKAMLAAALGEPFHIVHGGSAPTQYAADVAQIFIRAARADVRGAFVYSTGGEVRHMREVVDVIKRVVPQASITFDDKPFMGAPPGFTGDALEATIGPVTWRPLDQGVAETIERFSVLAKNGMVSAQDL